MLQGFHYWQDACHAFGLDELIDDPRFNTAEKLMANAPGRGRDRRRRAGCAHARRNGASGSSGMKGQWAVVQNTLELADDPRRSARVHVRERVRNQLGGEDLGRSQGVLRSALDGVEARVVDEIFALDVPAKIGPVGEGLEHREARGTGRRM